MAAAYINPRFVKYVSTQAAAQSVTLLHLDAVYQDALPYPGIVFVSGSVEFFQSLQPSLAAYSQVIWSFEQVFRDKSYSAWKKTLAQVTKKCYEWSLHPVSFPHHKYGGATNAVHLVAFSSAVGGDWANYTHPPNVARSISHSWNPAAKCRLISCADSPPSVSGPVPKVITFNNLLRVEGLLSVRAPFGLVCGPSVFKPGASIARRLTPLELHRLYDLPMVFDPALLESSFGPQHPLPFEASISPTILASIFCHVWGFVGGVERDSPVAKAVLSDSEPLSEPEPPIPECLDPEEYMWGVESHPEVHEDATVVTESSDLKLDSLPDEISEVEIIVTDAKELINWDVDSDDDSYMPRKPKGSKLKSPDLYDWEGLEDESTCCLESTEETASLTSCDSRSDSFQYASSVDTTAGELQSIGNDSDSISIASAATLNTSTSKLTAAVKEEEYTASQNTLEAITKATIGLKAVKADDAEVPTYLWDLRVLGPNPEARKLKAMHGFRLFGQVVFLRCLRKDCTARLEHKFGRAWRFMSCTTPSGKLTRIGREKEAIRNLLWHASHASWFEYHCGSHLYHFRFPIHYQRMARDGVPIYFEKPGPSIMNPQPDFPDPAVRERVKSKVDKVIRRRYMAKLTTGVNIKSLIKYFAVPKGVDDVRIVYDGTASGLNESVWAPSFWLPTIDSLIRALDSDAWMSDRDIGDMFLNFKLHESAWPFAGVDIKPILDENGKASLDRWYYWVRNAMGFKSSPYNSIKMTLVAEEVVLGDRRDPTNPFQWNRVQLNIPGTLKYDPSKSWIIKIRQDGKIASVLFTFVDDERIVGATRELAWQASSRLAKIQAYLGIQDAARKVGVCLQQPRAWAGAVVHVISDDGVYVLTSEEKWAKLKDIIAKWLSELDSGVENLDHKDFISDRGFVTYVTRAYPAMIPYVKGFHLTAEMWRGNRDEEGWKLPVTERADVHDCQGEIDDDEAMSGHVTRKSTPKTLTAPPSGLTPPAPRLRDDLLVLLELTKSAAPPLRLARPKRVFHVFYGFGDASGKGRGSTFQGFNTVHHPECGEGASNPVVYRVGVWGADDESESSNYREFTNLVEDTELEAASGRLREAELFLFTDNSTAESAFYKGSSSSKKLHALVLRLHKLSIEAQVTIHMIHVSGKRMIAQGTDGCSRGVLMEGVMAGKDMLSFIELDKSATERFPPLLDWIRSWTMQDGLMPLTPEEWFVEGHGICGGYKDRHGIWMPKHEPAGKLHLWAPPPAVADAMFEELLKARHKRNDTFHVIVVPRLMAPRWRRLFHKVSDLHFVVPAGASFWPSDMYEPLWVGVVLPFTSHRPWQFKRAPLMVELARKLCEVCKDSDFLAGNILRKLLKLPRRLASVPPSVASGVLHLPGDRPLSDVETS